MKDLSLLSFSFVEAQGIISSGWPGLTVLLLEVSFRLQVILLDWCDYVRLV